MFKRIAEIAGGVLLAFIIIQLIALIAMPYVLQYVLSAVQ